MTSEASLTDSELTDVLGVFRDALGVSLGVSAEVDRSEVDRSAVAEQVKAGDELEDVAKDHGISPSRVAMIAWRQVYADRYTQQERAALDDANVSLHTRLRVACDGEHTRRRFVGLAHLSEDQLEDAARAGLVAKGQRRTKAEMASFRLTLYNILAGDNPMTVRQVFYQMVGRGLPKAENEYARVQQELVKMRRGEVFPQIPYGWIADATRWQRKPTTYTDLEEALERTQQTYRRDLWANQPVYVELWLEKDALAGVLVDVTSEWDVPLMVSRGFSSVSFLYEASESIWAKNKPAHIYIFTDRDRSGDDIAASIESSLTDLAPDADITCHRAAVTEDQVRDLDLPTRPPKREGDPPAVELDAIPAGELRRIARDCIERHIDPDLLERTRAAEAAERETLEAVVDEFTA